MLDILGKLCIEVDMIVNKHKEDEYILESDILNDFRAYSQS